MPKTSYNIRRIVKNFLSLNLVQLSNFIFPLIILPYVVRIIGVEKYGLVSFVQAFIMYFIIISDYGFNLAGTREISLNRGDRNKTSEIFSSILIVKLILGVVCLIILFVLVLSVELFAANKILYLISTGILFGSILFPHWFFQGIERMETIPAINISIKTLQVILIFIYIKEESDYIIYMALISIAQFVIGITGLVVSVYFFKVRITFPSGVLLLDYLKRGFSLFSANVGINLFVNSNAFVLGIFTGNYAVGIFSAADKVRLAIQSLITSFTMSAYPNAVRLVKELKSSFIAFIKKMFIVSLLIGFASSLFLFLFSEDIIMILFGNEFGDGIIFLHLFSVVPFIVSFGLTFSILIIVPKGYDNLFTKIILFSVVVHFLFLIPLVLSLNALGAVYAIIITEFLISLLSILVVFKKKLLNP